MICKAIYTVNELFKILPNQAENQRIDFLSAKDLGALHLHE
jgi:hypothetical protein